MQSGRFGVMLKHRTPDRRGRHTRRYDAFPPARHRAARLCHRARHRVRVRAPSTSCRSIRPRGCARLLQFHAMSAPAPPYAPEAPSTPNIPARAFGAPHTTCSGAPPLMSAPASMVSTCSLSASRMAARPSALLRRGKPATLRRGIGDPLDFDARSRLSVVGDFVDPDAVGRQGTAREAMTAKTSCPPPHAAAPTPPESVGTSKAPKSRNAPASARRRRTSRANHLSRISASRAGRPPTPNAKPCHCVRVEAARSDHLAD